MPSVMDCVKARKRGLRYFARVGRPVRADRCRSACARHELTCRTRRRAAMYLIVRASRGDLVGIFSLGRNVEKSILNQPRAALADFGCVISLISQRSSARHTRLASSQDLRSIQMVQR